MKLLFCAQRSKYLKKKPPEKFGSVLGNGHYVVINEGMHDFHNLRNFIYCLNELCHERIAFLQRILGGLLGTHNFLHRKR